MSLTTPERLVEQLITLVESKEQNHIRLNANGGNSVLLVFHPPDEALLIRLMRERLSLDHYSFIDLNQLLVRFVQENKESLELSFDLLRSSVEQIFKLPDSQEGTDLFSLIMNAIKQSYDAGKVPIVIHAGALYGSGIDNIHIMEHPVVMQSKLPLIILYPATHDQNKLLFLGKRPASKYRCLIIE